MDTVMDYIRRVTDICEVNQGEKKPLFLVAGPVNAGKSTLVNSLLGKRVCPDDAAPSSLFPVHIGFSETPAAIKQVKGRTIRLGDRELRDTFKNRKITALPEKAEILLPSDILRWCWLVDTPGVGLSPEIDSLVGDYLSKADGIMFLFHQRGIDESAYKFLAGLGASGIKGWISFWINANTGLLDGTSLAETKQVIRSIFPGKSDVYTINTADRACADMVSLYLRVRAMDFFVKGLEGKLSRTDRTIPGMIERASLQTGDDLFLVRLWEVLEKAASINYARQAIKDLPLIQGNMANMLSANSSRLTNETPVVSSRNKAGRAGHHPGEAILSLLNEINSNSILSRHDRQGTLKRAAEIYRKKFRVMLIGPFSTGKTTFLNALLGETLLPAEDRATTSCPVILRHGVQKTAEVEQPHWAEFFPASCRDGKYSLDYREVRSLTQILENPSLREQVSRAEICMDGLYKGVTLSELSAVLDEMCVIYNRNSLSATPGKTRRIPLFSRKITAQSLPGPAVTAVRLTLGRRDRAPYCLDDGSQRLAFYRAISPPGSCLAKRVIISHPSENLSFAEFIDTPGLDSLHKRHYDRAAEVLSAGNLALFFLHAKHVLNGGIPGQISVLRNINPDIPVFYVINFADTISEAEREKVSLYIRQRLGQEAGTATLLPYPRVYTISAINALQRGDDGFARLLRQIRERTEYIEAGKLAQIAGELTNWLTGIAGGADSRSRLPEKARQEALYYLGELDRFTKRHLESGVI